MQPLRAVYSKYYSKYSLPFDDIKPQLPIVLIHFTSLPLDLRNWSELGTFSLPGKEKMAMIGEQE